MDLDPTCTGAPWVEGWGVRKVVASQGKGRKFRDVSFLQIGSFFLSFGENSGRVACEPPKFHSVTPG